MFKKLSLLAVVVLVSACAPSMDEVVQNTSKEAVRFVRPDKSPLGSGSLVRLPNDQLGILTNAHVCDFYADLNSPILIQIKSSTYTHINIVKVNRGHDLCLLKAPKNLKEPHEGLHIGASPKILSPVLVVGYPLDNPLTPAFGYLLERTKVTVGHTNRPHITTMTLFTTSVVGYPGNSGSPVVDYQGKLIAVINSGNSDTNTLSAIPYSDVLKFLDIKL